jgi:site-specific recombinase XerC
LESALRANGDTAGSPQSFGRVGKRTQAVWVRGKGKHGRTLLTLPEPTRGAISDWLAVPGEGAGPDF